MQSSVDQLLFLILGLVSIVVGIAMLIWREKLDERDVRRAARTTVIVPWRFRGPSAAYTGGFLILLGGFTLFLDAVSRAKR
ncbi:MAG: hypothetical protein ACRDH7_06125 [Actinomycetota bacterium]